MFFPYSFWHSSLLRDLIAFYTFNDASNIGRDSLGKYHMSEFGGTMNSIVGKIGNAVENDTLESYMAVDDPNKVFNLTTDKTFAFWARVPSATAVAYLVGKEIFGPNDYYTFYIQDSAFRFTVTSDTNNILLEAGPVVSANTWYFFVGKHDLSTKTCYLQINNGTPDQDTYSGNPLDPVDEFKGVQWNIQGDVCHIDSLGIWNRILSDGELAILYNNGQGINRPF